MSSLYKFRVVVMSVACVNLFHAKPFFQKYFIILSRQPNLLRTMIYDTDTVTRDYILL